MARSNRFMRSQRQSKPWIQRYSRFIITAIATLGAVITAYLAITQLAGSSAACPTEGCDKVLESPYATVFGLPLAFFGLLAYIVMGAAAISTYLVTPNVVGKETRSQLDRWTRFLLFAGSTAMMVFSGYLVNIMAFEIRSFCLYCVVSAVCSLALFVVSAIGNRWEDIGQLIFIAIIVAMVTLVGTLGVYSDINNPQSSESGGYNITTNSNSAELTLARHLTEIDAKMYGAFWCGHCLQQKQLFGREAVKALTYIECDPNGQNPQPQVCQQAGITNYPTWEINGEMYSGVQSLDRLADLSNYQGSRDFDPAN